MRTVTVAAQILVRLCFLILIVLGIGSWTGHWIALIPVHMATGIVLVLGLWSTSILAAVARAPIALVVGGLLWGVVVIALGMKQMVLMPGSNHWVIQVLHLLVG